MCMRAWLWTWSLTSILAGRLPTPRYTVMSMCWMQVPPRSAYASLPMMHQSYIHATHTHTHTQVSSASCQNTCVSSIRIYSCFRCEFARFHSFLWIQFFVPVCPTHLCVSSSSFGRCFPYRVDCYMSPTIYTLVFSVKSISVFLYNSMWDGVSILGGNEELRRGSERPAYS
jgi:hypothetical protein